MNKKPDVNEAARKLAQSVLEGTACAWCRPGGPPGTSHGICKRHWAEMMRAAGQPEEKIEAGLNDPNRDWAEDLGVNELEPAVAEDLAGNGDFTGNGDLGEPGAPGDEGEPGEGEPGEGMRQVQLGEILTNAQMNKVVELWNSSSGPEEALNRLRGYLVTQRTELESKGVVPEYLAYMLYAEFTGTI